MELVERKKKPLSDHWVKSKLHKNRSSINFHFCRNPMKVHYMEGASIDSKVDSIFHSRIYIVKGSIFDVCMACAWEICIY